MNLASSYSKPIQKMQSKLKNSTNIFFPTKRRKSLLKQSNSKEVNKAISNKFMENPLFMNSRVRKLLVRENSKKFNFTLIVQYARQKIKKQYTSPYIMKLLDNQNFNIMKKEERPIYYNLYKINNIFDNRSSRINLNFSESNMYYDDNEYLIQPFKRFHYVIIMRYLLAYVYDKDFSIHYDKYEYKHKTNIIKEHFQNLVSNNYVFEEELLEDKNSSSERVRPYNLLLHKNFTPSILKPKSLLFLYEYEQLTKNKIRDNLFAKVPKYYFVKDVPIEKVPNIVPNFYIQGHFMYSLLRNHLFYKKFIIFEVEGPKKVEKKKNDTPEVEENKEAEQKKEDESNEEEEEENSSKKSSVHSERFLDNISLDSDSEEEANKREFNKKKFGKRITVVYTNKEEEVKKVNHEDNFLIEMEKLIKKMENKKRDTIEENQMKKNSKIHEKKTKKNKLHVQSKEGFKQVNTDNFQIDVNIPRDNFSIQRAFSKKAILEDRVQENIPQMLLENLHDSSAKKVNKSFRKMLSLQPKKYFITAMSYKKQNNGNNFNTNNDNMNQSLSKKNNSRLSLTFPFKKQQDNFKKYYLGPSKTLFSLDKENKKSGNKYNYNYKINQLSKNNGEYPHGFKTKDKLLKQRKISFSIKRAYKKNVKFKETSEFISGIKKKFRNKKHQKKLIKEIITNYGLLYHQRNQENKSNNKYQSHTNINLPELNDRRIKALSDKKYKVNTSGQSEKNKKNKIRNQKEIFREYIDFNGIFKHSKINMH